MYKFTVSSNKIVITDPIYGCQPEGFCQNIIGNVENGLWLSFSDRYLIVINEKYNEAKLEWKYGDLPCGVDSGLIGVYDYLKYAEYVGSNKNTKNQWNHQVINWGKTIETGSDGFYAIQIGYNDQQVVCGIREGPVTHYYCDECGETINLIRYHCENCCDYDLCKSCFEKKNHNQNHLLIKCAIKQHKENQDIISSSGKNEIIAKPNIANQSNKVKKPKKSLLQKLLHIIS